MDSNTLELVSAKSQVKIKDDKMYLKDVVPLRGAWCLISILHDWKFPSGYHILATFQQVKVYIALLAYTEVISGGEKS